MALTLFSLGRVKPLGTLFILLLRRFQFGSPDGSRCCGFASDLVVTDSTLGVRGPSPVASFLRMSGRFADVFDPVVGFICLATGLLS